MVIRLGVAVASGVVATGEAVAEDGAVAGVNGTGSSSLQAITVSNIRRAVRSKMPRLPNLLIAMPSPIPPLPPVTMATFPLRSNIFLIVQVFLRLVVFRNVALPHEVGTAPHLA